MPAKSVIIAYSNLDGVIMYKLVLSSPLRKWKKGQMPISPFVYLSANSAFDAVNNEFFFSAQLTTDNEVDVAINNMIKELEKIRISAKKELISLRKEMLA